MRTTHDLAGNVNPAVSPTLVADDLRHFDLGKGTVRGYVGKMDELADQLTFKDPQT